MAALITGGRRGFTEFVPGASDVVIDGADGEEEIWTDDLYELLGRLGARLAVVGGGSSGARTLLRPVHPRRAGRRHGGAFDRAVPGAHRRLVELPLQDQDVPLIPFTEWAPHEETIARVCAEFILKELR